MTSKKPSEGLDGIIAGESEISTVGIGLGLNYRGYNIVDLAKHCIFEEVAHLLLYGHLPNASELALLQGRIAKMRWLPNVLVTVLEALPKNSNCMDVMRTTSSVLGIIEPEGPNNDQFNVAIRLMSIFGPALIYWFHFSHHGKRIHT